MKLSIPAYVGVQTVQLDISDITQAILDSEVNKSLDSFAALNALLVIVENIPDETIQSFNWALRKEFARCFYNQADRLAGVKDDLATTLKQIKMEKCFEFPGLEI